MLKVVGKAAVKYEYVAPKVSWTTFTDGSKTFTEYLSEAPQGAGMYENTPAIQKYNSIGFKAPTDDLNFEQMAAVRASNNKLFEVNYPAPQNQPVNFFGMGGISEYESWSMIKATNDAFWYRLRLSPARLAEHERYYASKRSSSSGLLGDVGAFLTSNPLTQVVAPQLYIAGETAKHPIETAAIVAAVAVGADISGGALFTPPPAPPIIPEPSSLSSIISTVSGAATTASEVAATVTGAVGSAQGIIDQLKPKQQETAPVQVNAPAKVQTSKIDETLFLVSAILLSGLLFI